MGRNTRRRNLGGGDVHRRMSGRLARVDGRGDIDGGPDNIGDGFPHDSTLLVERSGRADSSEEGAGQSQNLGNGGHCE